VGEANVVERMRRVQAVIGGEGANGGIIYPAVHYCRDSYLGMALLLERLAETGETLNSLAAALPRYWRRSGKFPFEHGRLGQMMQALEAALPGARADRTDGLKLMLEHGWVHVRASNTEPLVRVSAEAKKREEADRLYALAASLR
jgi:phosphomannomutase